jgi:hypothetical protein
VEVSRAVGCGTDQIRRCIRSPPIVTDDAAHWLDFRARLCNFSEPPWNTQVRRVDARQLAGAAGVNSTKFRQ